MEENMLRTLAALVLPTQILEFFTIVSVREVGSEFHISLDERMSYTDLACHNSDYKKSKKL